ncbi:hypothetical protein K443DRAFT_673101 [Laccaria amethystina LaAM-08-1]|uniref:Uncharacterized protein n=1 Tax=Laccaria amethystina LaAM-08-1 TaxID=1095629 RepID=A0A0C9YIE6_9AGAR|nr:hypothetical protein K443DRAFT_673101 [Laccaria amethystina LaAM-08-1]
MMKTAMVLLMTLNPNRTLDGARSTCHSCCTITHEYVLAKTLFAERKLTGVNQQLPLQVRRSFIKSTRLKPHSRDQNRSELDLALVCFCVSTVCFSALEAFTTRYG